MAQRRRVSCIGYALAMLVGVACGNASKSPTELKAECERTSGEPSTPYYSGTPIRAEDRERLFESKGFLLCLVTSAPKVDVEILAGSTQIRGRTSDSRGDSKVGFANMAVDLARLDAAVTELRVAVKDKSVVVPVPLSFRYTVDTESLGDDQTRLRVRACSRCEISWNGVKQARGADGSVVLDLSPVDLFLDGPIGNINDPKPTTQTYLMISDGDRRDQQHLELGSSANRHVIDALKAVDKHPLAWARALEGPKPRAAVVLDLAGEAIHATQLVRGIGASKLRDIQIVAHARSQTQRAGQCGPYRDTGGADYGYLPRNRSTVDVTAFEARTGKQLASKRFVAAPPPCPARVVNFQMPFGPLVQDAAIDRWLAGL